MRLGLDLQRVETKCSKKDCRHDGAVLHRHHVRSEKFFIGAFSRSRARDSTYKNFCARYAEFHKDDVVVLCEWHHREIHELYHRMYVDYSWKVRRATSSWTWKQARRLMDQFARTCDAWIKTSTPGSPPWPSR